MTQSISGVLQKLERQLRERLDPLGYIEAENGAFMTGHEPHKFPHFYLFRRYAGLDKKGLQEAEAECERHIYEPYKELLSFMNGASVLGLVFQGAIGCQVDRSVQGVGQPISLRYGNVWKRPDYIPEGHFRIGSINGDWHSQGHLFLASTGEVELYNAKFDLVGKRWSSLVEFLIDEIPRRLDLYDDNGREIAGGKKLPGDTDNWEQLAKEVAEQERRNRTLVGKVRRLIRGN